jgi:hypothetical protein
VADVDLGDAAGRGVVWGSQSLGWVCHVIYNTEYIVCIRFYIIAQPRVGGLGDLWAFVGRFALRRALPAIPKTVRD